MVYRRYNDFVAFHDLLLARFPYRLIPKLPPKKMGGKIILFFFHEDRNFSINNNFPSKYMVLKLSGNCIANAVLT